MSVFLPTGRQFGCKSRSFPQGPWYVEQNGHMVFWATDGSGERYEFYDIPPERISSPRLIDDMCKKDWVYKPYFIEALQYARSIIRREGVR